MDLSERAKALEHFITPQWAVEAILSREIMTRDVIDPCAGTGVLTVAARAKGYTVCPVDIFDWGFPGTYLDDFLAVQLDLYNNIGDFSVIMNPPFSKACEFVQHAQAMGAKKILCFQRFAWWESAVRRPFWDNNPPSRVYICAERASCWRYDLPINERGKRYNPKDGKEMGETPTAHAWFIWEAGHKGGTTLHRLYKDR